MAFKFKKHFVCKVQREGNKPLLWYQALLISAWVLGSTFTCADGHFLRSKNINYSLIHYSQNVFIENFKFQFAVLNKIEIIRASIILNSEVCKGFRWCNHNKEFVLVGRTGGWIGPGEKARLE